MTVGSTVAERCHFPVDGSTRQLFGLYVRALRGQLSISLDGLVKGTKRDEQWAHAIEQGQLAINLHVATDIATMFAARGRVVDVFAVIEELQASPFGPTATYLRRLANMSTPTTEERSADATSDPRVETISTLDKLIVVTPALLLTGSVALIVRMTKWAVDHGAEPAAAKATTQTPAMQPSLHPALTAAFDLVKDVVVPAALVATIVATFCLGVGNKALRGIGRKCRTKGAKDHLVAIEDYQTRDAIKRSTTYDWEIDDTLDYMIPGYRARARTAALRAEYSERTFPILVVATLMAFGSAIYAGRVDHWSSYDYGPVALGCAFLALLLASRRQASTAASECAEAIRRGLGWVPTQR